ncbi:MAG: hypothetical protein Q9214_006092 [Letrouitia sp. 1 TL-2023]
MEDIPSSAAESGEDAPPTAKESAPRKPLAEHKKLYAEHNVPQLLSTWFIKPDRDNTDKLQHINSLILDISKEKNANLERGQIPIATYQSHIKLAQPAIKALQHDKSDDKAWNEWKRVKDSLALTNTGKALPETWTFPINFLQEKAGIEDRTIMKQQQVADDEPESASDAEEPYDDGQDSDSDGANSDSGSESFDPDLDDSPEGLKSAVERKYKVPLNGTVLGYRNCGPRAALCLIQYGSDKAPTYRLMPGSDVGNWDRKDVINLARSQRGGEMEEDLSGFRWNEGKVRRYFAVAWRVDEDLIDPVHTLRLDEIKTRARPPETYVGVEWTDGTKTWETRTTIRRLMGHKKASAGDHAIYVRAKSQEVKYLQVMAKNDDTGQAKKAASNHRSLHAKSKSAAAPRSDYSLYGTPVQSRSGRSGRSRGPLEKNFSPLEKQTYNLGSSHTGRAVEQLMEELDAFRSKYGELGNTRKSRQVKFAR